MRGPRSDEGRCGVSELGIIFAVASALTANVAILCKHRGATMAPTVRFTHPLQSAIALFRSKWWLIGFAVAAVAWGFHVIAMALAPLSMVQVVTAGGLALLALPAQKLLRNPPRPPRVGRAHASAPPASHGWPSPPRRPRRTPPTRSRPCWPSKARWLPSEGCSCTADQGLLTTSGAASCSEWRQESWSASATSRRRC